jgi:hypothetical protein
MPIHQLADGSSIEYVEIEDEPRHHVLFQVRVFQMCCCVEGPLRFASTSVAAKCGLL